MSNASATSDPTRWLESWYAEQCDGEWEHGYGVRIDTLDNPGWSLVIDLKGTAQMGRTFEPVDHDGGEHDWLTMRVSESRFEAHGDARKLSDMIWAFRDWVEASAKAPA